MQRSEPGGTHSSFIVCILFCKEDPAVKTSICFTTSPVKAFDIMSFPEKTGGIFWAFATSRQLSLLLYCRYLWMNCLQQAIYSTKFTLCASSNFHKSVWELLHKHFLVKGILASGLQTTYICSSLWETALCMRDCLNSIVWLLFPDWVTISIAERCRSVI